MGCFNLGNENDMGFFSFFLEFISTVHMLFINLLRSELPWQAEYISTNVSRFYKILVKHIYVLDIYKLFSF